jgi:hypothetical protein
VAKLTCINRRELTEVGMRVVALNDPPIERDQGSERYQS